MRKIIGIGESILDIIFRDNQPVSAVPGGSVFNTLISLGRCEIPAYFISELGQDTVGEIIRAFMHDNRLNTDHIDFFTQGNSPIALAFLDTEQNARYQFYKNFPEQRLQVSFPVINEGDIVVIGSYFAVNPVLREKVFELLQYASEQKAIIYYDINFRQAHAWEKDRLMDSFLENFSHATLIRCSDEDLNVLFPHKNTEEVYEEIISSRCPNFIVTQGEKEIQLFTRSFRKDYPVKPVKTISTIGAGDSFNAGVIYGMTQEESLSRDLPLIEEKRWDSWMNWGKLFASTVCQSLENYVPKQFLSGL